MKKVSVTAMKLLNLLVLTYGTVVFLNNPAVFGAGGSGDSGAGGSTGCVPSGDWVQYGFALPGDPVYGFTFADNNAKDLVGLAAKGNIIIGDYTDKPDTTEDFLDRVLPKLTPPYTKPYVIDPTDVSLGYASYVLDGKPYFNGDYGQPDGGTKLDTTPRRFYESSLSDAAFVQLIEPRMLDPTLSVRIDAVLFTNHALAGLIDAKSITINGSMVSRDEGLMFGYAFYINHDLRLINAPSTQLALPFGIRRPKLIRWQECPPSGCTP